MGNIDPFDTILRRRAVPVVPQGLAYRIIDTAKSHPQQGVVPPVEQLRTALQNWAEALIQGLAIPRPALALATVLFLGIIGGLQFDIVTYDEILSSTSPYITDSFELESWL